MKVETHDFKFDLGQTVKDKITGFQGILICRSQWLNGCNTYGARSQKLKDDGSQLSTESFDEPQLELVEAERVEPSRSRGGPEKTVSQPNQ